MDFFTRLSNGWKITMSSFDVLKKNKQLLIFPVLSGISMVLIMAAIIVPVLAAAGWDVDNLNIGSDNQVVPYLFTFLFYLVNYFVVVFFNMALIHCTKLYLQGEEVSVMIGIKFSMSRIGVIFSWALFAATVGTILKAIQENSGWLGKIVGGILGFVWGVTTFFVVPVIAYEQLGPIDAFKRSGQMMKEKWGESLSSTFSLGLIQFIAFILILIPCGLIAVYVNPVAGIALGLLLGFIVMTIISAAQTIFVSLVYQNINGNVQEHFNQQIIDNLFERK
ncbi:DUF6159 family protein [Ferruginibacter sp. SUN106]|uniref:DUF6159 family protein n=1 Tax=Ferruginibacter sp. SUN106 TaxID=2978348 RepID=UPI003D35F66B